MEGAKSVTRVIYADVLVITNIIVNYLLLRTCAVIMGCRARAIRLLASSALGGVYSLMLLADGLHPIFAALMKVFFLVTMVPIAFKIKSVKTFLRCCAVFLLANFGFAGIMLAVRFMFAPQSMMYQNGAVYFDIDLLTLTVTALGCYGAMSLILFFAKSRVPQCRTFFFEAECGEIRAQGKALYDTGNSLTEGFSGRPVIVCGEAFASELLDGKAVPDTESIGADSLPDGFRLIPFSTVSGAGVMPAFRADCLGIFIGGERYDLHDVYIACARRGTVNGEYDALIGTAVFDMIDNEVKGFENLDKQAEKDFYFNKSKADANRNRLHKRSGYAAASAHKGEGDAAARRP